MTKKRNISNFRHLGGYRNKDGLRVKDNLIYRSGELVLPPVELAEKFNSLNITIVFDLRSSNEIRLLPNVLPDNILYKHYPILNSMEEGEDIDFHSKEISLDKLLLLEEYMLEIYKEMGETPKMFGDIIKEMIKNGEKPILFHCAAGKDRTGILAAMILLALGIPLEDVKTDYLLSNEYRKEKIELEVEKLKTKINDPLILDRIEDIFTVKEEYLKTTLDSIKKFESFDKYGKSKLGLTTEDLKALRKLYLE